MGAVSAMWGRATHGPTALIQRALKIDQVPFQSALMNMKFHPSAMNTREDMRKVAALIRTYFSYGGKHIQFNVADKQTLKDAQKNPANHRDLMVRVAGYSAYFVQLGKKIQDEVIGRTEHTMN
jgi:pyruvate-formate lyase